MAFTGRTIFVAQGRQSNADGFGSWCAKCGKPLWKRKEVAIPRISINQLGKWSADNCVILCSDCLSEIRDKGIIDIPCSMLPFFSASPPDWYLARKTS
jgi:hypothetical protein